MVLAAFLIVAGFLSGLMVYSIRGKDHAHERAEIAILAGSRWQVSWAASSIYGQFGVLRSLDYAINEIYSVTGGGAAFDERASEYLNAYLNLEDTLCDDISITTSDGKTRARGNDILILPDVARRAFESGKAIGYDPQTDTIVFAIKADYGQDAVLIAEYSGDGFGSVFAGVNYDDYGVTAMINSSGDVIWSTAARDGLPEITGSFIEYLNLFKFTKSDAQTVKEKLKTGARGTFDTKFGKTNYMFAFTPFDDSSIPENDFFMLNGADCDAYIERVSVYRKDILIAGGIVFGCILLAAGISILIARDRAVRTQRENERLINIVERDPLTGLYKRETFLKKCRQFIDEREDDYYMMSCFDVDDFKVINELYGEERGDEVLISIARNLERLTSGTDCVYCRLFADSFAIINAKKNFSYVNSENLLNMINADLGGDITLSLSVGRYDIVDRSISVDRMLEYAQIAKTYVKGRYDRHLEVYDDSMSERLLQNKKLAEEAAGALKAGDFEVWYQPQYNFVNKTISGAEALVRWKHPVRGLIPPNEFIPVFELNGFIFELDKYVWKKAAEFVASRINAGEPYIPISVNVSRYDLFCDDFLETITEIVTMNGLTTDKLRLEITESAFAKDTDHVMQIVDALRAKGFIVEMDDFGSSYSSLNALKDVNADVIKLDMRFLSASDNGSRGGIILESCVRMGRLLGMSLVAEGVETRRQADFLCSVGCYDMQGYYFAKPMSESVFRSLISRTNLQTRLGSDMPKSEYNLSELWDIDEILSILFSGYIGPCAILETYLSRCEIIRVSESFRKEVQTDLPLNKLMNIDVFTVIQEDSAKSARAVLNSAVESGEVRGGEVIIDVRGGTATFAKIKYELRVIAKSVSRSMLLCKVQNVTDIADKEPAQAAKTKKKDSAKKKSVSEQSEQKE